MYNTEIQGTNENPNRIGIILQQFGMPLNIRHFNREGSWRPPSKIITQKLIRFLQMLILFTHMLLFFLMTWMHHIICNSMDIRSVNYKHTSFISQYETLAIFLEHQIISCVYIQTILTDRQTFTIYVSIIIAAILANVSSYSVLYFTCKGRPCAKNGEYA